MSEQEVLDTVVSAIGGETRPGQQQMLRAVSEALAKGEHLVVQAGTGTGKSLGYLIPAALHAREHGPVVVATATLALQRQLITQEIPRVAAAVPVSAAVLKGRHHYVCRQRLNAVDDDQQELVQSRLADQARAVHAWAAQTTTGDRDDYPDELDARVWRSVSVRSTECVGESRCAFGAECFAAQARMRAAEADIVVTNHALLAIDAVENVPVLPEYSALIIDEAHEFGDRVTSAVSIELAIGSLERLASRVTGDFADVVDDFGRLALEEAQEGRVQTWSEPMLIALTRLRDASREAIEELSSDGSADDLAQRQRIRGAFEEVNAATQRMIAMSPDDVIWWDTNRVLHAAPLQVADALAVDLFERGPAVLTSATLAVAGSFDGLLTGIGLGANTRCLVVDTGFDYAQQGILYVASAIPPPSRDGVAMEALDELALLIEAAGGRTLALFSSWRGVERAADYLRVRLSDDLPLLVQQRGESAAVLIEHFAADERSVLIGTVSLWQGIDVPGRSCILVAIDRIPFPRPDDPVLTARASVIDEAGGSGFREVSLARAAVLLAQGAGRLIRAAGDRGVVAILDSRMVTARYGAVLRSSLPPLWFTTDRTVVQSALERLSAGDAAPSRPCP
jgi:ATP-dependent DNA helicase DinG